MKIAKVFVAEFIGTFALVFVGAASGIYMSVSSLGVGLLGVALAHGFTIAAFVYVFGYISGAHFNPAVTLGLAANGNIKWIDAPVYWLAQFLGAGLAALSLKTFVTLINATIVTGMATNGVLTAEHTYYALALEALLTFFLVNAVLHTAVGDKAGPMAGWAIGTTLTVAILAGGPLTGASLNPARSFGPAIFTEVIKAGTSDWRNLSFYVIYFVGPFIGAIVAALVYQFFKYEPVMIDDMEDEEVQAEMEVEEFVEEVIVEEPVKKTVRKSAAPKTRKSAKNS
jgi:MIP family channel proteins